MQSNETCPKCGRPTADIIGGTPSYVCGSMELQSGSLWQSKPCQIACLQRDLSTAIADKERVEGERDAASLNAGSLLQNRNEWKEKAEAAEADAKAKGEMIGAIEAEINSDEYQRYEAIVKILTLYSRR